MTAKARKKAPKEGASGVVPFPDARPLTDPREIRAIAHPVRIALLEALTREGPLTATQAAELVDESPANCSFHLRTLARYGFVEEAPGGTGRQRPWRRISLGQSIELGEGGETSVAALTFAHLAQERTFERLRNYMNTVSSYPEEWQDAGFIFDRLAYLTPEELAEVREVVLEQLAKFRERSADKSLRPAGSRAVQLAAFAFPLPATPSGN